MRLCIQCRIIWLIWWFSHEHWFPVLMFSSLALLLFHPLFITIFYSHICSSLNTTEEASSALLLAASRSPCWAGSNLWPTSLSTVFCLNPQCLQIRIIKGDSGSLCRQTLLQWTFSECFHRTHEVAAANFSMCCFCPLLCVFWRKILLNTSCSISQRCPTADSLHQLMTSAP